MPSRTSNPQVVIVGGGFAGPVLALALKSRGISSEVFDLRPQGDQQGGNIGLAPNALRVLDSIGVYDQIRVMGYNYDEVYLSNPHGTELGRFLNGSPRFYNYPATRVHRRDVRDLLLARLDAEGIPVHYSKKFKEVVEETASSVTVAFEDGTRATGDFVVGCDGIHSRIRHHVYPNSDPEFQGVMGIMGTVYPNQLTDVLGPEGQHETSRWPVALPRLTFGDRGMFGTFPADFAGLEMGFMTTQRMGARSRKEWEALEHDKSQLKQIMERAFIKEKGGSDYPAQTRLLVERARPETLSSWPFYVVPTTPAWYSDKGRIVFIGDAAHAIPPTGGQGAAMAFEDAATLALTLSRVYRPNPMADVHNGSPVQGYVELLQRWHLHRKDRVRRVHDFTTRNGELMKSSPMWAAQAAKEWAIWVALKLHGPGAGSEWLYSYHCEDVLAALAA